MLTLMITLLFNVVMSSISVKATDLLPHYDTDDIEPYGNGSTKLYGDAETASCILPTSRHLVVAYPDDDGNTYLFIKVIDTDGSSLGSVRYQLGATYQLASTSTYAVSETVVYIFVYSVTSGNPSYYNAHVVKFNPQSLTYTKVSSSASDQTSDADIFDDIFLSPVFLYNAKYYCLSSFITRENNNNNKNRGQMYLIEYTPDSTCTNTNFVATGTGANNFVTRPFWIQESAGSATCYMVAGWTGQDLSYWTISLSAKTKTLICNHPEASDIFDPIAGDMQQSKCYGGWVSQSGTVKALQFMWIKSYVVTGTALIRYVNWIGYFNNTIETATILSSNRDSLVYSTGFTSRTTGIWNFGYAESKQRMFLWWLDYSLSYGGNHLRKMQFDLEGDYWIDDLSLTYEMTEIAPEDFPTHDVSSSDYIMGYCMSEAFSVWFGATETRIYYGLASYATVYDFILTYSPVDSPLKQGKVYTFTATTYADGYVSAQYFKVIVDGILYNYYHTSATSGVKTFQMAFNSAGIKNVTLGIYNPAIDPVNTLHDETFYYSVVGEEADEDSTSFTNTFLGQSAMQLITYLPLMLCIFVPAFGLSAEYGGVGFVGGIAIGSIIASYAGLLPFYAIFLILLVIVIGVIMILRGGFNVGGGGS